MRLLLKAIPTFLFITSLVCLVGCGGDSMSTVTGVVTLDGKPVQGLEVNFEPTGSAPDRTTATGYTLEGGKYSLFYPGFKEGAPAGEYIVRITGGESLDEEGPKIRVPAKYNTESELKETIASGENTLNFDLTSE
ncbi:MAG: hypothetical protein COA78_29525 [Blastopirellula sp.]|nr:MAG: hypothetical protein COA78_29525 [Blastopirellula sp.]